MTDRTDTQIQIPAGYVMDSQERLVPVANVKPADRLMDQTVDTICKHAYDLSAQIARFNAHTIDDVAACVELLAEQYGVGRGGVKGNVTLTSYDGRRKVVVAMAESIAFGPELQCAKDLVDACISEWGEGSRDEIKAIVGAAFDLGAQGRPNREALLRLRRLEIDDDRWRNAMKAVADSMRVASSKEHVRIYERASRRDSWAQINLNVSTVKPRKPQAARSNDNEPAAEVA